MYVVEPGPTYRDAREQHRQYLKDVTPAVERVADLFLRLPRTKDAEIAATVHFVAKELSSRANGLKPSECDVFKEVKAWKVRRNPPLEDTEVAKTIRYLNIFQWVDLSVSQELTAMVPEFEEAFL
jgi:hypothetical protein